MHTGGEALGRRTRGREDLLEEGISTLRIWRMRKMSEKRSGGRGHRETGVPGRENSTHKTPEVRESSGI